MNEILTALTKAAAIVAEEIKRQADSKNVPKVSGAVSLGAATKVREGDYSIKIIIDTNPDTGAPAAGAYEWGSGERATVGPKAKIPIKAKNAPLLAWPKEDWPQYDPNRYSPPRPQPDWHYYPEVEHPGVFPRPYIKPSITIHMQDIAALLGKGAVVEITGKMKLTEKIVVIV